MVTIQKLYCNTTYLLHYYIAIQFSSLFPLQYTLVYCNTISISLLLCNTTPILQYNYSLSPPISIHFLMLQYNLASSSKSQYNIVYCNTLTQPHQSCNTMPWLAIQLPCHTIVLSQYNFPVRPEKFQFLEKGQNRNFDYKIVILIKNPEFIL